MQHEGLTETSHQCFPAVSHRCLGPLCPSQVHERQNCLVETCCELLWLGNLGSFLWVPSLLLKKKTFMDGLRRSPRDNFIWVKTDKQGNQMKTKQKRSRWTNCQSWQLPPVGDGWEEERKLHFRELGKGMHFYINNNNNNNSAPHVLMCAHRHTFVLSF